MSETDRANAAPSSGQGAPAGAPGFITRFVLRPLGWIGALAVAAVLSVVLLVGLALSVAYPNLPEISGLTDYRPKLPLRVFSADGVLLGEFGEERRNFTPISQIPKVMQNAV